MVNFPDIGNFIETRSSIFPQSRRDPGQRVNRWAVGSALDPADIGLTDAGSFRQFLLRHIARKAGSDHRPNLFVLRPHGLIFRREFRVIQLFIQILMILLSTTKK